MFTQWLILLLGCGTPEMAVDIAVSPTVRVATAMPSPEESSHTLFGSLEPTAHAVLSANAGGEVVSIPVAVGEQVNRSTTLVQLDATVTAAQVSLARTALREAKYVLDDADKQLARALAVTDQRSTAQTDAAVLGQKRANAAHKRAEANLQIARHADKKKRIVAPFSGEVVQLFPAVGEMVGPGAPVVRIADTSSLEIEVGLSSTEVAVFDPATATFEVSVNDVRAAATLKHVAAVSDPRTRTWPLTLTVPKTVGFVAGAAATVSVSFPTPKSDAMVPLAAISENQVWTVDADRVFAAPVTVVAEVGTYGLVRGIAAGTTVVLSPPSLDDGAVVTVLEEMTQ